MALSKTNAFNPLLAKNPTLAAQWAGLGAAAAKPGHISGLVTNALGSTLGQKGGPQVGKFTERLLNIATTKGSGEAVKYGSKMAPTVLKSLGKFTKLVPGVGLAWSSVSALKTFADPSKTGPQKTAAVMDVGASCCGLIPGVGTAAQVAAHAGTTAVSMAADAAAPKSKGWTPA